MPIPRPHKSETHDDFIGRCMADEVMNAEYGDTKQRYAICQTQWENRGEKKRTKTMDAVERRKLREFRDLRVNFISLVFSPEKPANREPVIIMRTGGFDPSKATFRAMVPVARVDRDLRMIYAIVYSPDVVDTEGTYAKAETIRAACERFMAEGRTQQIDRNHDYIAGRYGYLVENWIVRANDALFPEQRLIDSWAVGVKVTDDETWGQIVRGECTGVSLAGMAELGPEIEHDDGHEEKETGTMEKRSAAPVSGNEPLAAEEIGLVRRVLRAVGLAGVKRGEFADTIECQRIWELFFTLQDVISRILDGPVAENGEDDRVALIVEAVREFLSAVEALEAVEATSGVAGKTAAKTERVGKVFSKRNLEALKGLRKTVDELIAQMDEDGGIEKTEKIQQEGRDMEELKAAVERISGLEAELAAMKSARAEVKLNESDAKRLADLETKVTELIAKIVELEKAPEQAKADIAAEAEKAGKTVAELTARLAKIESSKPAGVGAGGDGGNNQERTVKGPFSSVL